MRGLDRPAQVLPAAQRCDHLPDGGALSGGGGPGQHRPAVPILRPRHRPRLLRGPPPAGTGWQAGTTISLQQLQSVVNLPSFFVFDISMYTANPRSPRRLSSRQGRWSWGWELRRTRGRRSQPRSCPTCSLPGSQHCPPGKSIAMQSVIRAGTFLTAAQEMDTKRVPGLPGPGGERTGCSAEQHQDPQPAVPEPRVEQGGLAAPRPPPLLAQPWPTLMVAYLVNCVTLL